MPLERFTIAESYEVVYHRQKEYVTRRIQDEIPDTLLVGEHGHVITLGRKTHRENLLNVGTIPVIEIERGGDVTYHGPGVLVGYPILQLNDGERDLHRYLRHMEQWLINTLQTLGLEATRKPGWTGVWLGEQKVASIGVAVKKWVTYHGFALNVCPDLLYYQRIQPCGLPATTMTSLSQTLNKSLSVSEVIPHLLRSVTEPFKRCLVD